jgi:hypothetical protein
VISLLLIACGGPIELALTSPSEGAILRSPWVPISVRVPLSELDSTVSIALDGEPLDDPLGFLRERQEGQGGEADYLGTLDLVSLVPGDHRLEVELTPRHGAPKRIASDFLYDRPPHRVDFSVEGEGGEALSARILVNDASGPVNLAGPDAAQADPGGRDVAIGSVFARDGSAVLYLDPGDYRFLAVRGIRDAIDEAAVTVDQDVAITLRVPQVVPTPDEVTADLHVHTGRSADAYISDRPRLDSLLAADLDVVVSADHTLPDSADFGVHSLPGVEARVGMSLPVSGCRSGPEESAGHLNVFPVTADPFPDTRTPTFGAYLDAWRQRQAKYPHEGSGTDVLLQLAHPRGIQFEAWSAPSPNTHALFNTFGFDPGTPVDEGGNAWMTDPEKDGTIALDFDAMEIVNRFSWELYLEVRQDWFALLDQGFRITGTGNSDSHAQEVELAGFPVNLVRVPPPSPGQAVPAAAFVDAIQDGRVSVTNGPIVHLTVEAGGASSRPGDLAHGAAVVAHVQVRAAPWVPVDELRLVVDGVVVQRLDITPSATGSVDVQASFPLALTGDAWILAEAGVPLDVAPLVPEPYALIAPGSAPLGFTNPVRVDADADGLWTAPGLSTE